ncbi:MAG: hypothetical protein JWR90_2904 [Marmoricola sp.]|nr:hypothetical protein [Marmoricola sp.]
MALFRRRSPGGSDDPSTAFWQWWTDEGRGLAEQSIAGTLPSAEFGPVMTEHVRSLGELGWELAPGETTEHVLVITSEGAPDGRALARRLVLAAPDADETWSYVDTRPPSADPDSVVLGVAGVSDIALSQVRVAARMNGSRFDVQVHHPSFADLPEDGRAQVTFLALDAALGEIDAELWLGEVQPVEFPPLDGFGLTALRSVVQDLKGKHLDADGRPSWAMLRGETASGELVAMVRSPLHPLTAPHLDTYVGVALPFAERTAGGLPDAGSLETLRQFDERLEELLGTSGQVVAHLSTGGVSTLHVYVDSTADLVPTIKGLARTWGEGKATVHDMHDPGWEAVTHLRV